MDRYVVGGSNPGHHGIAVDTWEVVNGKWVKTGVVTYDSHADYKLKLFIPGALTLGCPGYETKTQGINGEIVETIPLTPQADETLKGEIDAASENPPRYHVGLHNCNWFVMRYLLLGIVR